MKRLFHLMICFMFIASIMFAFPITSNALSDEMTHVYDQGSLQQRGRYYDYYTDTAACKTSASASVTFDGTAILTAEIEVSLLVGYTFYTATDTDAIQGHNISVSVTNIIYDDSVPVAGEITAAIGTYKIGVQCVVKSTVT